MGLFDFLFNSAEDPIQTKFDELSDKAYNEKIRDDDISLLNDNEKIFFVLYVFDMEFQNGGLCQFFVNSSRVYAPLVSEYLGIVGAAEHQKMFDDFVVSNKIDLSDLSFFIIKSSYEYQSKFLAYPFEKFDHSFGELTGLVNYLGDFMKNKL